jgi:membrane associated rhomboid family serine protease
MIPVGISEKTGRFPWMTGALILANVAAFVYLVFYSGAPGHVISRWGFTPTRFFHAFQSPIAGISCCLTLLSASFLHGSLMHIAGNMLFLWVFGPGVEHRLGTWRYLSFYLLMGAISMIVHGYAFKGSTLVVIGASGSIAGIMGAFYILYPNARIKTSFFLFIREIPAIYYLFIWFLFNLGRGFLHLEGKYMEPVAWWAHVGGFLAGTVLVNLFLPTGGGAGGKAKAKKD